MQTAITDIKKTLREQNLWIKKALFLYYNDNVFTYCVYLSDHSCIQIKLSYLNPTMFDVMYVNQLFNNKLMFMHIKKYGDGDSTLPEMIYNKTN